MDHHDYQEIIAYKVDGITIVVSAEDMTPEALKAKIPKANLIAKFLRGQATKEEAVAAREIVLRNKPPEARPCGFSDK